MLQQVQAIILWDEISEEPAIHYETADGKPILLDRDEMCGTEGPVGTWSAITKQLGLDDGDEEDPTWRLVGNASTARVTLLEGSSERNHLCTVQIIW